MLSLDIAKIVAMVSLGVGSFFIGILPVWFSPRGRQRWPLLLSTMLCFGGGVLLATAVIHMLPEVRKELPEYAEIIFCGGFFLVYLVDEMVHYFWGESIAHTQTNQSEHSALLVNPIHDNLSTSTAYVRNNRPQHPHRSNYGSTVETANMFIEPTEYIRQPPYNPHACSHGHHEVQLDQANVSSCCAGESSNARICHVNHTEPCNNTTAGRAGLLIALCLHSVLEGLAIGLQDSAKKVLLLAGAVASHKLVVGFCLGVELSANAPTKICSTIFAMLIFSMGSAAGIGLGMEISDQKQDWTKISLPVLQALAGGTLLYVTVCEVLPRERSRWHQKPLYRSAGLAQFFAVAVGFTAMTLLNIYLAD